MRWFYKLFGIKYCKKCGSTNLEHHFSWNGGHNLMLNQAIARKGTRCFNCGDMVWNQTDEEYEASLPEWCMSHREINKDKEYGNWKKTKHTKRYSREDRKDS